MKNCKGMNKFEMTECKLLMYGIKNVQSITEHGSIPVLIECESKIATSHTLP